MSEWGEVVADTYEDAGVAASAVITPKAGGTARTYKSCKLNKTTDRVMRSDGTIQHLLVQEVRIPQLPGATAPAVGEFCSYNGGGNFVIKSVAEEAGLWIPRSV